MIHVSSSVHFEVCFFLAPGVRKTRVVWAGYINQMNESISNSWLSTAFCSYYWNGVTWWADGHWNRCQLHVQSQRKFPCCFGCMWRGNGLWAIATNVFENRQIDHSAGESGAGGWFSRIWWIFFFSSGKWRIFRSYRLIDDFVRIWELYGRILLHWMDHMHVLNGPIHVTVCD